MFRRLNVCLKTLTSYLMKCIVQFGCVRFCGHLLLPKVSQTFFSVCLYFLNAENSSVLNIISRIKSVDVFLYNKVLILTHLWVLNGLLCFVYVVFVRCH